MGKGKSKREEHSHVKSNFFEGNASGVYVEVRDKLVVGKDIFNVECTTDWPSTELHMNHVKGSLTIRPEVTEEQILEQMDYWRDRIKNNILNMNDLTADVLDIITCEWLKRAQHHESMITIAADDFLAYRALQPKMGGRGKGGYHIQQKKKIAEQIEVLRHTWINILEMLVPVVDENGVRKLQKVKAKGPAIMVSLEMSKVDEKGGETPFIWKVRPGDVFAPFLMNTVARQTALISIKALQYSPYHHAYEKRLTRYLAWQWRIRQGKEKYMESFRVKTLLERIHLEIDKIRPTQTKEKFEKVLDRLEKDKVIAQWRYHPDDFNEEVLNRRGWYTEQNPNNWPFWRVIIEPPSVIIDYYRENILTLPEKERRILPDPRPVVSDSDSDDIGKRLFEIRQILGMSLQDVAEAITKATGRKISKVTLSRIENGLVKPRTQNKAALLEWLNQISPK